MTKSQGSAGRGPSQRPEPLPGALPLAPLAMPRQVLEGPSPLRILRRRIARRWSGMTLLRGGAGR